MNKKIQLGILFGSRACEHEVSIISALQLASMANPFKYDVIPIYISKRGVVHRRRSVENGNLPQF